MRTKKPQAAPAFDPKAERERAADFYNDLMRRCPAEHIEYVFEGMCETADMIRGIGVRSAPPLPSREVAR